MIYQQGDLRLFGGFVHNVVMSGRQALIIAREVWDAHVAVVGFLKAV